MTAFRTTAFGGMIPRLSYRLLPDNAARLAANCNVVSGELLPMRGSKSVVDFTSAADSILSMFRPDDTHWFAWPTEFVQMARGQIQGETRFYYTGDGVPKVTTIALGTPVQASGAPAAARTLGIPNPVPAPTVSHSGGVGAAVTRYYCYTFYSDWNEESGPSPVSAIVTGKVDGTWAISAMDDLPPNSGSITAATHASGVVTITTSANNYLRAGDVVQITGVVGMTDLNNIFTVSSVVDATHYKVALTTAQTYTSGGTWTRQSPWGTCTKRLYRTSGTVADFQLVKDALTGTTYDDTLTDALIPGDSLISTTWEPPQENMIGLVSLPGGVMAGYYDKTIYLCEPYQHHAWPNAAGYRYKTDQPIVGLAVYDNNIVAATEGAPYILSGYEPGSMSITKHKIPYPCLSRGSVVSVSDGIVYSTRNGMARVTLAGTEIFTDPIFSKENWYAMSPTTIRCAFTGTRLLIFATAPTPLTYILNISDGGPMVLTYNQASCAYADESTGYAYFGLGKSIYEFDSFDGIPQMQDWWSKEFVLAKPENVGAAKVDYDDAYTAEVEAVIAARRAEIVAANAILIESGKGLGCVGANAVNAVCVNGSKLDMLPENTVSITFLFYAAGMLMGQRTVTSTDPFRLPDGYKSDRFSFRVLANTKVQAVVIANTVKGLATA